MKLLPTFLLIALLGASRLVSLAAETPRAAPVESNTAQAILDSFVGGSWIAALPADEGGTITQLELRFDRTANQQGVRFDSSWLVGGKRSPYTSGMYAWDAAAGKFNIFYTDSSGSLTRGPVTAAGDVLNHELTVTDKAGKVEPIRVHLTRQGADAFTNEILVMKDGGWTKFVEVRYVRQR